EERGRGGERRREEGEERGRGGESVSLLFALPELGQGVCTYVYVVRGHCGCNTKMVVLTTSDVLHGCLPVDWAGQ
ncbi:MAG: hypothetical protein AAGJ80_14760, partial [Cyanobacteria bacterium J06553_1]